MSLFLQGLAHDLPGLLNEFGQLTAYTPKGGLTRELTVIKGEKSEPAEFENVTADGNAVWIRVIAAQVPELAQGDAITMDARNYTVDAIEPDRAGTVRATLINAP